MPVIVPIIDETANPLDLFEAIARRRRWTMKRGGDDEINLLVAGSWGDLHMCLSWREDIEGLHLACGFSAKAPVQRREETARLICLINEQLLFGHFDLRRHDGTLMFRNGLLLCGGAEVTELQCESLMELAVETCERFHPCFQFVIRAGKSSEEALEASLLETRGEA